MASRFDPGLWPADLTERDREAFVRALVSRVDDDVQITNVADVYR